MSSLLNEPQHGMMARIVNAVSRSLINATWILLWVGAFQNVTNAQQNVLVFRPTGVASDTEMTAASDGVREGISAAQGRAISPEVNELVPESIQETKSVAAKYGAAFVVRTRLFKSGDIVQAKITFSGVVSEHVDTFETAPHVSQLRRRVAEVVQVMLTNGGLSSAAVDQLLLSEAGAQTPIVVAAPPAAQPTPEPEPEPEIEEPIVEEPVAAQPEEKPPSVETTVESETPAPPRENFAFTRGFVGIRPLLSARVPGSIIGVIGVAPGYAIALGSRYEVSGAAGLQVYLGDFGAFGLNVDVRFLAQLGFDWLRLGIAVGAGVAFPITGKQAPIFTFDVAPLVAAQLSDTWRLSARVLEVSMLFADPTAVGLGGALELSRRF